MASDKQDAARYREFARERTPAQRLSNQIRLLVEFGKALYSPVGSTPEITAMTNTLKTLVRQRVSELKADRDLLPPHERQRLPKQFPAKPLDGIACKVCRDRGFKAVGGTACTCPAGKDWAKQQNAKLEIEGLVKEQYKTAVESLEERIWNREFGAQDL